MIYDPNIIKLIFSTERNGNPMRTLMYLIIAMILLAACVPGGAQTQTQSPQLTYTPYPTYTPFPTLELTATSVPPTPIPTNIPTEISVTEEPEASVGDTLPIIARNYLGELEDNGIKVELARVLLGYLKDVDREFGQNLKLHENFQDATIVLEVLFRITNNTDKVVSYDTMSSGNIAFINDAQISFERNIESATANPIGDIYPGLSTVLGYYLPVTNIENLREVNAVGIGLSPLYESDSYDDVTGNFFIKADINPMEWTFEPLPDELSR